MTTSFQYFKNMPNIRVSISQDVKEQAHLYDINNNPKILPEKYAMSKAELIGSVLHYNHTPIDCVCMIEEATLPKTP